MAGPGRPGPGKASPGRPGLARAGHFFARDITISRKVKNSALRYFHLNAKKNTSLGTAGYVRTRPIL